VTLAAIYLQRGGFAGRSFGSTCVIGAQAGAQTVFFGHATPPQQEKKHSEDEQKSRVRGENPRGLQNEKTRLQRFTFVARLSRISTLGGFSITEINTMQFFSGLYTFLKRRVDSVDTVQRYC